MTQVPNLLQAPEPVETAELHFKTYCKLKVSVNKTKYEGGHCSLLAISQYYGLIFVGDQLGFTVMQTKTLSPTTDDKCPSGKYVNLFVKPTHLSVDFSQQYLAVVCGSKPDPWCALYDIQSFKKPHKDIKPLKVLNFSKIIPNFEAVVVDITWQPVADGSLMFCMSDGSVLAVTQAVKGGSMFTLPNTTQATCFCWSPKGKQIVIGTANGTLSQYKPDLKIVKTISPPPLFNGAAMVVSVLWISSFQFAVAYNDRTNPEFFPVITIVNAAKSEPVNVINYEDITYSSTLFRNHQIYMYHLSAWNLIFVSSANSIEVAVLHSKDGSSWEQWLMGDASRAELPLNPERQETFPLGWAFDFTSQNTIPWGEGSLPPMPRLLLRSDEGILCVFNVINVSSNAPQVCAPPKENFDESLFKDLKDAAPPSGLELGETAEVPQSILGAPPTPNSKPGFTFKTIPEFGGFGTAKPQTTSPQVGAFQQDLKQPQTQTQTQGQQQQQLPQQPLVSSTQPAVATSAFKLSNVQFGSPSPFSFGAGPTFTVKPATTNSPTVTNPAAPGSGLQFGQPSPFSFGTSSTLAAKPATTNSPTVTNPAAPGTGVQFGRPSPFSFGTSSTLTTKPATTKSPTVTNPAATPQTAPLKPAVSGNIFAGKTPLQTTSITQLETPVITTTPTTKKPEDIVEHAGKIKEIPVQVPDSPKVGTPELATVDNRVYLNALEEEIEHFNSELQQLSMKVSDLNITVGSEEDKAKMKKNIDDLNEFMKELDETTKGQSGEIHTVTLDLLEAFAWLEDAKSRNLQRKNPSYIELRRSEELDPLSARRMSEIGHLKYYIENQLKQLTSHLEKEWMDHQENYRNEVKGRMAVPPLEEIYKTMHYQLKILHKQINLLEELEQKVAKEKRKKKSQTFLTSSPIPTKNNENRTSELSKLAENLLQMKINTDEDSPSSGASELLKSQIQAISERSKKLTRAKQSALRDALCECDIVKIRPVKTNLESSTFLRSLALEKVAQKSAQPKPQVVAPGTKENEKPVPTVEKKIIETPEKKSEAKPVEKIEEPSKINKPTSVKAPEVLKSVNGSVEKSQIPLTVQSLTNSEEKSPLTSLSDIVSNIGKKNETNLQQTFVFGSSTFQKPEQVKDAVVFGSVTLDQKQEKPKPTQTFTFGSPKPTFGSKEPIVFSAATATPVTTKSDLPKTNVAPNVTITPVTSAPTSTVPFTFGATTTTTTTSATKMNFMFSGKDQSPVLRVFGTATTAANSPTAPPTITQSSTSGFGSGGLLFGSPNTTTSTFTTSTAPLFGSSTRFTFTQPVENKNTATIVTTASAIVATAVKPTSETEEVDVVKVEEPVKKSETPEKSIESPKVTVATNIFGSSLTVTKGVPEVTATTAPSTFSLVGTSQSSDSSSVSVVSATTVTTTSTESPVITSVVASSSATTTVSTFSSPKAATPVAFGQSPTTTTNLFGTPTTTANLFGQVSSTTPTNIFGGAVRDNQTTNIFGVSTPTTPTKPVFGQAATPTTTSKNIFGSSTPTTSTFGQATTPSTPPTFGQATTPSTPTFGQKSDTGVSQATNLFGQLLSDNNRSVFGTSTTPSTPTTNIFSTPKNLFGGGSSTTSTASLFGTTSSSIFPQTTSVFGQATTSPSVFGQSQTSPSSNTFFGQNICSPFGGGTSVPSNQNTFESGGFNKPIFGQSLFKQTTNNTSIFGGSTNSTVFGGTPSTTAVFQTRTTSTTFGSLPAGPFSGKPSTFGSPGNSFQKNLGGFGSPPVFGGSAFGASPTFGGSPSFGSMPTFGSLSQSQGTFGQSTTGSTTFENLANQNTVGFGNLAQQSQNQGFRGGAFGSPSFENKPAFEGNSFSCWRSK